MYLNAGADPGFLTGSPTTQRRSNLLFGIIFAENWVKIDVRLLMQERIQDFPDGGANPKGGGVLTYQLPQFLLKLDENRKKDWTDSRPLDPPLWCILCIV